MLYDKKWDKQAETKTDPLTLPPLIAWLEKQNPRKTYDYCFPKTCLLAHYLISLGETHYALDPWEIPDPLSEVVNPFEGAFTYGAALKRARALIAHD